MALMRTAAAMGMRALRVQPRIGLPAIYRGMGSKVDPRTIPGEYPTTPAVSAQLKEPWGYWDPQERRNFGEALHENDDVKSVWIVDEKPANGRVKDFEAVQQLLVVLALLAGVWFAAKAFNKEDRSPVKPRSLPYNDRYFPKDVDA